jgi:broad specificity phosphatase PhoE
MPDTVVHLVRHGEVDNPTGILYGRLPGFRLSEAGELMAKKAARWFAGRDVVHLVSSPLERARQTAQPIADELGLPVEIDERLTEAGNAFEGTRFGGPRVAHPAVLWRLRNPWRPSWGEPYVEIAARMLAAVRAARDAADGRDAVCVSHQLPIVCARRQALGQRLFHDPRRRNCALGSVTSFTFAGDTIAHVGYHEPAGALPSGQGAGA